MENSISRNQTPAYLAQIALRTLEVGELEERIATLEKVVNIKKLYHEIPIFDAELDLSFAVSPEDKEKDEAGQQVK